MIDPRLQDLDTPFYVIDLPRIRDRYAAIHGAFASRFASVVIGYSYKTNYVPAVLHSLHSMGAWAEVVSSLEYELARRIGVRPDRIIFNGPNKDPAALGHALEHGALVNLDSLAEVAHVVDWMRETRRACVVGLRVNVAHPEYDDHRSRSRFGFTKWDLGKARDELAAAGACIVGLHAHLSTRSRGVGVFRDLATAIGGAARVVMSEDLRYIDVGGGFGHAAQGLPLEFPSFDEYADEILDVLANTGLHDRTLIIEPGTAIVADAVSFFCRVCAVKSIGDRRLAFVDGSVHNVKPTRHALNLPARVHNARGDAKAMESSTAWDLVGYTCMDDDYIAVAQRLPDLEVGDVVEISNVGAYTVVFAPPFIQVRPPIYTLDTGELRVARRIQTIDDFLDGYALPER